MGGCLACNSLSCVLDTPNCSSLLYHAYAECQAYMIDKSCCQVMWWGYLTAGFCVAVLGMFCCCVLIKRRKQLKTDAYYHRYKFAEMKSSVMGNTNLAGESE